MRAKPQPNLSMQQFLKRIARGLVGAQCALDERASESMLAWEQEGIPPHMFMWSQYQLEFPIALQCETKNQAGNETQLLLAPRVVSVGKLKLVFRYLPSDQDNDTLE